MPTREQFSNNVAPTLAAPYTAGAATLEVSSSVGAPSSAQFRIKLENEYLLVTGMAGNIWTVSGAQEGTIAANHAVGTTVSLVVTKGAFLQAFEDYLRFPLITETLGSVVTPFLAAAVLSLSIGGYPALTGAVRLTHEEYIKSRNPAHTADYYVLGVGTTDGADVVYLGDSGIPDIVPGSGNGAGNVGRLNRRWNNGYFNNLYLGAGQLPVAVLTTNTFSLLNTFQSGIALGSSPSLSGMVRLPYGEYLKSRNVTNTADTYVVGVATLDALSVITLGDSGVPDVVPGSGNGAGNMGRQTVRWNAGYFNNIYLGAGFAQPALLSANTFEALQTFPYGLVLGGTPSLSGMVRLPYGEYIKTRVGTGAGTGDSYLIGAGTGDGVPVVFIGDSGIPDILPGAGNRGGNIGRTDWKFNYGFFNNLIVGGAGMNIGAQIIWGLACESFTQATAIAPVEWSPGFIMRSNAWNATTVLSESHFFEATLRATTGTNPTKSAHYWTWLRRDAAGGGAGPTVDVYALNSDGQALHATGTSPLPSIAFMAEQTLGFYRSAGQINATGIVNATAFKVGGVAGVSWAGPAAPTNATYTNGILTAAS